MKATKKQLKNRKRGKKVFARKPLKTYLKKFDGETRAVDDFTK